ncbi:DUF445 family protein [Desulfurobacterium atlanticum]|uniref:Uncharacterized membrane protein YheB, UPF0754 family n=1 Tax=Desulfurobacterium atlanticum TaxID=240169 RepID=A0A239AC47_9BACT|nr:DUF445 family protein [Desulfurobacterium atlanticum]SNR92962.1 Uncharacterized membrane protein YheB, UPF0754 family [Desulfurobacterium atlanticum]
MNYELLVPPVVGGVIGYFTNYVAIKMLFRPKKPYYFFGKRIPFTPGLIPSKREKLAFSIAKVVKENLLTEDTLRKRLNEEKIKKSIESLVDRGLADILFSLDGYVEQFVVSISDKRLFELFSVVDVEKWVGQLIDYLTEDGRTLGSILPENAKKQIGKFADFIVEKIIDIGKDRIDSEEFREFLVGKILNFLEGSGRIPDVVIFRKPVFAIAEAVAERIIKVLRDTLESRSFEKSLKEHLRKFFESLNDREIKELLENAGVEKDEAVKKITAFIYENFDVSLGRSSFVKRKVYRVFVEWIRVLVEKNREFIVKTLSENLLVVIEKELPVIMESIDIENLVVEKVNSLPIEEVEGIILKLIDEELKYITLLGGVLGFIIGAFQDILFFM